MFSHDGTRGAERRNRLLAGYLALVAGYANSAGFVLIGTFSSHVTGNVGRLANDAALGQVGAAVAALTLIAAFFVGAFVAGVMVESTWFGHASRGYAVALALEALLLGTFTLLTSTMMATHPRVLDAQAALLCAAMGVQNGLVTRLSGAIVRTTHLTGVITDLGIESARWFRYWRKSISEFARVPLVMGKNPPDRPNTAKFLLLATIVVSFVSGALVGALVAHAFGRPAMVVAVVAVTLCAGYALRLRR